MITLRALQPGDIEPLLALFNDSDWQAHVSGPYRPMLADQLIEWARSWSTPVHILFVADLRGRAIGFAQLINVDIVNRHAEGAVVLDRDHRNGIYGAALMRAVHTYAKNTLNLRRIRARVSMKNEAAYRLCGWFQYRHVGILEEHIYSGGQWHDVMLMEKSL